VRSGVGFLGGKLPVTTSIAIASRMHLTGVFVEGVVVGIGSLPKLFLSLLFGEVPCHPIDFTSFEDLNEGLKIVAWEIEGFHHSPECVVDTALEVLTELIFR
jgi:hypothetical protein